MEIGTWDGGTLGILARAALPDAQLLSLDLNRRGTDDDVIPSLHALMGPQQKLDCVRGDSHANETLLEVEKVMGSTQLDLLYIDGDHTYEGVKQDYDMYSPLVRPGGAIVFHDIVENVNRPSYGVDRFWSELSAKHDHRDSSIARTLSAASESVLLWFLKSSGY